MNEKSETRRPIGPVLRQMKVGEAAVWPLCQYSSVNACMGRIGLEMDRRYRARGDREARTVTVTRLV